MGCSGPGGVYDEEEHRWAVEGLSRSEAEEVAGVWSKKWSDWVARERSGEIAGAFDEYLASLV